MYKKIDTIEHVNKGFHIISGELLYQSQNALYLKRIDKREVESHIVVKDDFQGIYLLSSNIIGISGSGYVLFDSNFHVQQNETFANGIGDFELYDGSKIVITTDYDYDLFLPKDGLYDLLLNKILWESDAGEMLKVESNQVFSISSKKICKRSIDDGIVIWTNDIENDNIYPELVGIYDDKVLWGLQEKDKLLAIDIETGAIKWEIDTFVKGLLIDKEKGLLHQMLGNYGAHDLKTGKLVANFNDDAYFESINIVSQRSNYVLVGEHIITTDWRKGVVGAFNTVNHKFDWVHKEEGISFPASNPIVYSKPYLVVHDNKDTLHIFEKE